MNTLKQVFISRLRNMETSRAEFRETVIDLTYILACEATDHLDATTIPIQTPIAPTTGTRLPDNIVLVPILRSGITLVPGFCSYFKTARIAVIGIRREEATAKPNLYYQKIPPISQTDSIIILDPMIATGGTGVAAISLLKEKGAREEKIIFVAIIASPEGIAHIKKTYPAITILVASIDDHLNKNFFIVPGLGDFGDRYFGTD
jgi:uracil phosphoribosyltransferase